MRTRHLMMLCAITFVVGCGGSDEDVDRDMGDTHSVGDGDHDGTPTVDTGDSDASGRDAADADAEPSDDVGDADATPRDADVGAHDDPDGDAIPGEVDTGTEIDGDADATDGGDDADVPDDGLDVDTGDGDADEDAPTEPGSWSEDFTSIGRIDAERSNATHIVSDGGRVESAPALLELEAHPGFGDDGDLVRIGEGSERTVPSGARYFESVELRDAGEYVVAANVLWRVRGDVTIENTTVHARGQLLVVADGTITLGRGARLLSDQSVEIRQGTAAGISLSDFSEIGFAEGDFGTQVFVGGPVTVQTRGGVSLDSSWIYTGGAAFNQQAATVGDLVVDAYGDIHAINGGGLYAGEGASGGHLTVRTEGSVLLEPTSFIETKAGGGNLSIRSLGDVALGDSAFLQAAGGGALDVIAAGSVALNDGAFLSAFRNDYFDRAGGVRVRAHQIAIADGNIVVENLSYPPSFEGTRVPFTPIDIVLEAQDRIVFGPGVDLFSSISECGDGGSVTLRSAGDLELGECTCVWGGDATRDASGCDGDPGAVVFEVAGGFTWSAGEECHCEGGQVPGYAGDEPGETRIQRSISEEVDADPKLRRVTAIHGLAIDTGGDVWRVDEPIRIDADPAFDLMPKVEAWLDGDWVAFSDLQGRDLPDGWLFRAVLYGRMFDTMTLREIGFEYRY